MTDKFTLAFAEQLDNEDPFKHYRKRFQLNDPNLIYLDGNSLGVLPEQTKSHIDRVIKYEWGTQLIQSWNQGWYERSAAIGAKISKLIGAQPDEIIISDSTSVNLFKLAYAALKFQSGKNSIVSDSLNFPSDLYILQGLIEVFGNCHTLHLAKSSDGIIIAQSELENLITNETALLTLSHVLFKSSFMYTMEDVTQLAHSKGALVIWDLSHSVGSVPINLNKSNADMAIGCCYKYLNGGPGAPAFLYVRKDLQDKLESPIWGWFGQHKPFDFDLTYKPAEGINRFMAGTPPLLSLSAIEPSIDMMLEAGMEKLREKSIKQTEYLFLLFDKFLKSLGFSEGTPRNSAQRGSHVSIRHPEAYRICKTLIDKNILGKSVIPDFREPDNIRLGIAPLYNTYTDIYEAVMQLKEIVETKKYEAFNSEREKVT